MHIMVDSQQKFLYADCSVSEAKAPNLSKAGVPKSEAHGPDLALQRV